MLGHVPSKRERDYLRRMTLVMGNRNQLQWDLPALDSFELNRAIYRLPREDFTRTRDELIELLDIGDLVRKPVRNLSLGERMKVEVVGSLLHLPQVLFLDEPTIGLDVTMQKRIRTFIAEYNQRYGATVLLTSHYMADVEALCKRVIVIHHGRILFDGQLAALARPVRAPTRRSRRCSPTASASRCRVPKAETSQATATAARRARGARPDGRGSADRGRDRAGLRERADAVSAAVAPRQESRLRSMVDFYVTTIRTQIQTQFQYRAATYMYTLGMVAEPTIYLVVWSTIARSHGGTCQRARRRTQFAAYYIVWTLVRTMNIVFTPLRLGVADPRRAAVGAAPAADPPHPLRSRVLRRPEGRCGC